MSGTREGSLECVLSMSRPSHAVLNASRSLLGSGAKYMAYLGVSRTVIALVFSPEWLLPSYGFGRLPSNLNHLNQIFGMIFLRREPRDHNLAVIFVGPIHKYPGY
jgi:hypothetical protein